MFVSSDGNQELLLIIIQISPQALPLLGCQSNVFGNSIFDPIASEGLFLVANKSKGKGCVPDGCDFDLVVSHESVVCCGGRVIGSNIFILGGGSRRVGLRKVSAVLVRRNQFHLHLSVVHIDLELSDSLREYPQPLDFSFV